MSLGVLFALAAATVGNAQLDSGRRLFHAMRYEQAAQQLWAARSDPKLEQDERRELFDLLARSLAAQGRRAEVESAYAELLTQDAEAPAPANAAPGIREAFRAAKERLYPPDFVKLARQTSAAGTLRVQVIDPWSQVASVALHEAPDAGDFGAREVPRSGQRVEVALSAGTARCFLEARSQDGRVLARLGSAEAPLRVATSALAAALVQPPPTGEAQARPRGHRRAWLSWAVAGAAVAAGVAGAAFAASSASDWRSASTQRWASDTRALDERAREKARYAYVLGGTAVVGGAGAVVLAWDW